MDGPPEKTVQLNADITQTKAYLEEVRHAVNRTINATTKQDAVSAWEQAQEWVKKVDSMMPNLTYVDGKTQWGDTAHFYLGIASDRLQREYPN